MNIVIPIITCLIGALIVWLLKENETKTLKQMARSAEIRHQEALDNERRIHEIKESNLIEAQRQRDAEWQRYVTAEKQRYEDIIETLRSKQREEAANAERIRAESEKQWSLRLDALRKEILNVTSDQIIAYGQSLRQTNTTSLNDLLAPIKEQFEAFRKALETSSTQSEVSKREIQDKFDSTLRLFQQQQEAAVKVLQAETARIGNDAVTLAQALKNNTKRQGNWGEMVLQTLLENSGLEENVHYFVQYNVKDEEGNTNIPDVVVRFPGERSVIIDSKVSLTAYTHYFETEDEDEKQGFLKAHIASVEKHVNELSEKCYPRVVPGSMDYVLMFIPNESSYIEAMKLNPDLLRMAYDKKVIVVSPNNLMMALQLAYNLWQTDKQIKNVEKIVSRGKQLYDKVCNFQASFNAVGDQIQRLQDTFSTAKSQLSTGRGSVLRQCEMLSELGIKPDSGKRLKIEDGDMPSLLPDDTDID